MSRLNAPYRNSERIPARLVGLGHLFRLGPNVEDLAGDGDLDVLVRIDAGNFGLDDQVFTLPEFLDAKPSGSNQSVSNMRRNTSPGQTRGVRSRRISTSRNTPVWVGFEGPKTTSPCGDFPAGWRAVPLGSRPERADRQEGPGLSALGLVLASGFYWT
jgi:hypothetical protein